MPESKTILSVRIPHPPERDEEAWNDWYNTVHVARRMDVPGFLGCQRFRALEGDYRYLTVYDLDSPEVLRSDAYRKVRDEEVALPESSFERITSALPGLERGLYQEIRCAGAEEKDLSTDTLFAVGHHPPVEREEEFNAWYDREHTPAMMEQVPGFLRSRRYRLLQEETERLPGATTPRPLYMSLYDLADLDVLSTPEFLEHKDSPWSSWVRSWYERQFRVLATRIH